MAPLRYAAKFDPFLSLEGIKFCLLATLPPGPIHPHILSRIGPSEEIIAQFLSSVESYSTPLANPNYPILYCEFTAKSEQLPANEMLPADANNFKI